MKQYLDIKDFYDLFRAVQMAGIFDDQKTMADAIPKFPVTDIQSRYFGEKDLDDFDLEKFVYDNFKFETSADKTDTGSPDHLPIKDHIEKLWIQLERSASESRGTLLELPKPYIVPGGRFTEFFYWDSYFIMLGLQARGKMEMMNNIVENCSYLIMTHGSVPNANRSYFLSRSQPPYFSLMLDLIYKSTNDEKIYARYFQTLKKEYEFWMSGQEVLENGKAVRRVLKTKLGDILNRYYDSENLPRPESYLIDFRDAERSQNPEFYRNIRAACESGWDFSSRWFDDGAHIETVHTLDLAPVDLNCLLFHLEKTLAKSSKIVGEEDLAAKYQFLAEQRRSNIDKYFWDSDSQIYRDFDFVKNEKTRSEHIASLYPMFLAIPDAARGQEMRKVVEQKFLLPGGLVTTTQKSGQQWDFPNAWAPNQWIGYKAMKNYGYDDLAEQIKANWSKNVERVYNNTGKLMEKYNAEDMKSVAGGGEYPNQDGFGWTNGVYYALNKAGQ